MDLFSFPRGARVLILEPLESRRLLAFTANINFQPSEASVPAGYVADTGQTYGLRAAGLTFGWNALNTSADRERNSSKSPDQRYDTLTHTQLYGNRTWELAVPNGQYSVKIVGGDAGYYGSTIRYAAEGVLVVSGANTSGNPFVEGTQVVTVADGKLTITNASGASNNKICFIDISSLDAGPTLPNVSISTTDSSASEAGVNTGTFKVTRSGSTSSALTVSFTIGGSATNGTDYNTLAASVVIPAGAASANVVVTPKDDASFEGNETVLLTLKSSSSYVLGASSATVNIADNDAPVSGDWPTSWTPGADNTRQRWESAAVVLDGKLWNFGGWFSASTDGTKNHAVYDPATNKWTDLKEAPIAHTHALAAADAANHLIYVAGGLYGRYPGVPTNEVWKFDTITLKWSPMPGMPQVHSSGGFVVVNNELHYMGGVLEDHDVNVGMHIVFNLANPAAGWTYAPDMPVPLDHFSTAVIGSKIYCIGGEVGHDKLHEQHADLQIYDTITKTWSKGANMPMAKSHAESSTFVTPTGKIIIAGGQMTPQKATDDVVEYDPVTNTWRTIGKLPMALQGPIVQQFGNKIIVSTGNPGTGPIKTMWIGELQ